MSSLVLTKSDYLEFRNWLNLNLDGLTWQGRFKKEFESFWEVFFEENLNIQELIIRFDYAYSQVKIGALSSWFLWLRDKFLNYLFIFKNKNIEELAAETKMSPSLLATILRNYLLDEFPHLDQYFNEVFQVGNILSENLHTSFNKIKREINISAPVSGSRDDEIMPSMEVTLFDEWSLFLKRMKSDFSSKDLI
jgi:AraC-like DNA-binding protein